MLDVILKAAFRRSQASADEAQALLDGGFYEPAYVWVFQSVEIYVKEVMLQAKDSGLSYAQECAALSENAPGSDDVNQWEAGCIAAGKADVTDDNPEAGADIFVPDSGPNPR